MQLHLGTQRITTCSNIKVTTLALGNPFSSTNVKKHLRFFQIEEDFVYLVTDASIDGLAGSMLMLPLRLPFCSLAMLCTFRCRLRQVFLCGPSCVQRPPIYPQSVGFRTVCHNLFSSGSSRSLNYLSALASSLAWAEPQRLGSPSRFSSDLCLSIELEML